MAVQGQGPNFLRRLPPPCRGDSNVNPPCHQRRCSSQSRANAWAVLHVILTDEDKAFDCHRSMSELQDRHFDLFRLSIHRYYPKRKTAAAPKKTMAQRGFKAGYSYADDDGSLPLWPVSCDEYCPRTARRGLRLTPPLILQPHRRRL